MSSTREIKRRISSIESTHKMTGAMEMVAAAKMRRTMEKALATREYSQAAWQMLQDIAARTEPDQHPLLRRPEVNKALVLILSGNRGLAGPFNSRIIQKTHSLLRSLREQNITPHLITGGEKGKDLLVQQKLNPEEHFEKPDVISETEAVEPAARYITDAFRKQTVQQVTLVYTHYISALKQEVHTQTLLPVTLPENDHNSSTPHTTIEPDRSTVLQGLIPRLVRLQIFQAALESNASEHAARMLAMRNAKDAASDMMNELTLQYNKARQGAITQEIAEISSGAEALK